MKVDDAFLEDAVLNIYAACVYAHTDRASDAGATLDLETLREEWQGYHLRRSDLDQALQTLIANGELVPAGSADQPAFAMTTKALQRAIEGRRQSVLSIWRAAKDLAKLTFAQNRQTEVYLGSGSPRRRAQDQSAAAS